MNSKALVIALLGVGCVAAAGAGAFLAVQSTPPIPVAATVEREAPEAVIQAATSEPQVRTAEPTRTRELGPTRSVARATHEPAANAPTPEATAAPSTTPSASSRTNPVSTAEAPADSPVAAPSAPAEVIAATAEAPAPRSIDERTLLADSVIGIRMDSAVSSETAHVEDRVTARVTRDVKIDGRTAIPAGAQLEGTVTAVERGGKVRGRSRIGIRFNTLVLNQHERLAIQTDTIFRDGESPTGEATSKIGASAVVGTILGAVIGGKKGAAIGGTAGAAGGTAVVMAGDRNEAAIAPGTPLTVRLTAPVTVQMPREE